LVAASFFALFTLLVALAVPQLTPSAETRAAAKAQPLWRTLGAPGLLAHFVAFALYFSCGTMGMMNLPLLLVNTLGGNESQIGIAFSVAPCFELPLMVVMGVLATRMPARRLIQGALVVAVVYYCILAFVRVPAQVYPAQFLSAAIVAVTSGVAITFFQDFLPNQPGTATNLYSNAQRIGSTVGYLCFGALTEAFGARGVFVTCSIISGSALLTLLAGSNLGALTSGASLDVD
jgi:SET family sugar efflux transporter-like MFS transporter